jgi:hypothetical protein
VSLTFSDPGATTTPRKYRSALIATVAIMAVVTASALVGTLIEGPRLRSVTLDEATAIQASGVTLSLRSDTALGPVSDSEVSITPATSFSLENTELEVRIVFDEPLLAATTYRVSVSSVSPRGFGSRTTWDTSFQTPAEEMLFLRSAGVEDELVHLVLDGSSPEVVYRAPGIVSFARVGVVYAVLRSVGGETFLELVEPESGAVDRIPDTPGISIVGMARAAWGTTLVMTLDTDLRGQAGSFRTLALLDTLGSRTPEVISGADGNPLGVLKVAVSDVSGNIVVWLRDQSLVRFDPLTGVVVPLGVAAELWGLDSLGESAVYVDSLGTLARSLSDGTERRIPAGQLEGFPVFHEFTALSPQGTAYQRAVVPGVADGPPFTVVTEETTDTLHTRLIGSLQSPQSIGAIGLSPNGQYLVAEVNPASSLIGFVGLGRDIIRRDTSLVIYDTRAQAIFAEIPGYTFSW